jgi:hypothetical protein
VQLSSALTPAGAHRNQLALAAVRLPPKIVFELAQFAIDNLGRERLVALIFGLEQLQKRCAFRQTPVCLSHDVCSFELSRTPSPRVFSKL